MFSANFPPKVSSCISVASGNISSFVTGSSELLVPGRVTAVSSIPQGSMTVPIEPAMLLGEPDVQQISVKTTPKGIIDLEEQFQQVWCQTTHWVRALRLSDDCHSYNVQLKLHPAYQRPRPNSARSCQLPKLILQAVRPIEQGQELLLWFSEDILAMLQIVFLTPANIQGQKKYVCTRCSALYESPNPLKLHMTLGCGKLSISTLWRRLSSAMNEATYNAPTGEVFNFQLSLGQQITKQKTAMDLTVSSPSQTENKLYRPYEPSAFKPFKKEEPDCLRLQPQHTSPPTIIPMCYDPCLHLQQPVYNDEAQIETLVSSLGKSRQGHICLYCGKCYSRKYGLKIHIRTHTGYKPLRCKFCSRPFGDPSNLNKHVRLHAEGNTPYK
ncbi:hypothetical protein JTB14_014398 [Gonioctena quinquepunctata]|nr:hypothetical protein JTB14_014398 [Gonioctena quinquepunctata]